ncbi:MAG TPA: cytidine deaminase [Jiangellales bacterium]|nr:cytidine deaminase [Jiangellales bacterium]
MTDLDPEDAKVVALARATRARAEAVAGAAVRDLTGRTYAAAPVDLPSLRLSALQVAVAMAASSGAQGIEAAAVVGEDPSDGDLAAVRDLGGVGTPLLLAAPDGSLRGTTRV